MWRPDPGASGGRAALIRWSFGLGIMLASIVVFNQIAPVHAIRGSTRLEEFTPLIYLFPIFLPIGLLVGEVVWRGLTHDRRAAYALAVALLSLALLGGARFAFLVPLSGHAVVLGFFLVFCARRVSVGPLIVGGLLLLQLAYYKLMVWRDPLTLGLGLVAGAALGGLHEVATGGRRRRAYDPDGQ
jgi:hypothetical protein